jgi:hypothetical protein
MLKISMRFIFFFQGTLFNSFSIETRLYGMSVFMYVCALCMHVLEQSDLIYLRSLFKILSQDGA